MNKAEALQLAQKANSDVSTVIKTKSIARLWAGMGSIVQIECNDSIVVIAKRISCRNPTSFGDKRKAASYVVECNFYSNYSHELCDTICCDGLHCEDDGSGNITILMTPLPNPTVHYLCGENAYAALRSVARLHAHFWGERSSEAVSTGGLAPQGSYWYLDTRPDEYNSMSRRGTEGKLRSAAKDIDEKLKAHPYQTCLHGDLKSCNMSLSSDPRYVTFVDFQYIGRGCAAKDLAYLFVCGMDLDDDFENVLEEKFLKFYIEELASNGLDSSSPLPTFDGLKEALDLAYCDLYRWMCGWGVWGNGFLGDRVRKCLENGIV
uniref:CHK kinase-like domain-containing protein n=1 Tax=Ditylum brightwellii TaxID=49249 RepID=A0A7S4V5Q2_9STRA